MSNDVFIIGLRKNSEGTITMAGNPVKHTTYTSALTEARRLCRVSKTECETLIFKLVTSVKQIEPVFEIVDFADKSEESLVAQPPEEEQQPSVQKDIEPLVPNNPYVPNKMVRSAGLVVQLYTLNPRDLFLYKKTTYRLLHSSYPYKARIFNTETNQEEDISSCVYVLPVTEQTP